MLLFVECVCGGGLICAGWVVVDWFYWLVFTYTHNTGTHTVYNVWYCTCEKRHTYTHTRLHNTHALHMHYNAGEMKTRGMYWEENALMPSLAAPSLDAEGLVRGIYVYLLY